MNVKLLSQKRIKSMFMLVLLLIVSTSMAIGQVVTIGTGTSTQRYPFNFYYGYGRSATIYTSAELGNATQGIIISDVAWESNMNGSVVGPTVISFITMGSTTAVPSATWTTTLTGSTQVWSGTTTAFTTGWNTFTLTSPFQLAAGDNLMVLVECNYGGSGGGGSTGTAFRYTSSGSPTGSNAYWQADGAPPTGTPTINTNRPNIRFTTVPATLCASTPTAGIASASGAAASGSVCPNTNFTLSTAGATFASGISYDWQYNDGNGWITTGNTNPTYTVVGGITTATDYRLVVICTNTNDADTSNVVSIAINPFLSCYCTPVSTCVNEGIVNVTMGTLNNTSAMCTTGGYQDFTGLGSQVTVTQGQQIPISVTDSINSNPSSAGVWIDYDHSGTFDASEFTFLGSTTVFNGTKMPYTFTGNITIPVGALTGVTAMRVRGANSSTPVTASGNNGPCNGVQVYGEYEDYLVTINAGTPCSGTPAAGTLSSTVSSVACPQQFVVSSTGFTNGVTGLSFQWEHSTDGITFTPVGSATLDYEDDTVSTITQTMYFRLAVSCGAGAPSYSDTAVVTYGVLVAPIMESFNVNNTTTPPNCWTRTAASGGGNWVFGTSLNNSYGINISSDHTGTPGSYFAWVDGSSPISTGQITTLTSPVIDISALTAPQVRYYMISYTTTTTAGFNKLAVDAYDFNLSDWVPIDSVQQNFTSSAWEERIASLATISSTTTQLRFRFEGTATTTFYNDILIDDIYVENQPTCPYPTLPTASNITATTADLSWFENGIAPQWEIEYGTSSFTLGTGTREIANTMPYTLGITTPLTSSTQYSYYVRSICGPNDTSAWSVRSPLFNTLATCDTPYNAYASNILANSVDLNWTDNNGASLWEIIYGPMPLSALTADTAAATFYPWSLTNLTSSTKYEYRIRAVCNVGVDSSVAAIGTFTTPPACGDNFYDSGGPTGVYGNYEDDTTTIFPTNIGDLVTVTFSSFYTESGWDYLYVYDGPDVTYPLLGTYTGSLTGSNLPGPFTSSDPSGALTFRFHSDGSGTYAGWEASVTCAPLPTCFAPSSLSATNTTATGTDLNWIDNNGALLWEIEYGPDPLTVGTGTIVYTSNNPYTIVSGLTPGTNYQFNVRAICNPGDTSSIAAGYFKTPPGCGGNFYDSGGPTGVYGNYEDDTTTIFPTNIGDLVTVTFSMFYTESCCDNLKVYDGPDASYPLLGTFGGQLTGSNLPGPFTSSDPSGALTFVFHSDISLTYAGWDASVTCAPPPTCPAPTNGTASPVTASTADLNWIENGSATQWEIEYGPSPLTLGNGTRMVVNSNPYTLNPPLNQATGYTYFVRSICGPNDTSTWSSGSSFTTTVSCPAPTGISISNITANSFDVNWTSTTGTEILEYGPTGHIPGTGATAGVGGTLITNATPPYTITGLSAFSGYDVFIRQDCSASSNGYSLNLSRNVATTGAPVNDTICGAMNLTLNNPVITYVNTNNATTTSSDPAFGCTTPNNNVWFKFTTNSAGIYNITAYSTQVTSYNTYYGNMSAWLWLYSASGSCPAITLTQVADLTQCSASLYAPAQYPVPQNASRMYATPSLSAGTTYYILADGADGSYGNIGFTVQAPLAIKLEKLTAMNTGAANKVEWTTLSEERSDKFELERSADGKHFAKIYEKQANGEASRYTYMDNNPIKGMNYYRLRMTEANGQATYSEVVTAFVKSNGFEVNAYPNPVSHDLTVQVSGVQGADATVQVMDVTGKVIRTVKMTGNVATLDMSSLANGIYLIKYSDADHTQTIRVNKQ